MMRAPERNPSPRAAVALLALLAASSLSAGAAAQAEHAFQVVAGGEVQVMGDEEVCFELERTDLREVQVKVRIRFTSYVPRGTLAVDGVESAAFREPSEELSFWVAPEGTHKLALRLQESATVDRLVLASQASPIRQSSCESYEGDRSRRADLEPPPPEPVNRLGRSTTPEPREEPEAAPPPQEEPVAARGAVLPAGREMTLTLQGEVSTRSAYAGKTFSTRLAEDVRAEGRTVLPAGTEVTGHVVESKDAGRFGRSKLTLAFDRAVLPDGTQVPLGASLQRLGKGSAKKQGGIIAGSALGGALLGQVLGGDSEATLLGAAVGASIAAGSIAAKPGEPIVLPPGTVMTVALDHPVTVPDRRR